MEALADQYQTDQNLRIRIQTHEKFTVRTGPDLEQVIDDWLAAKGSGDLLDVGTGPGDFLGRLRANGYRGKLFGVDFLPGMIQQASAKHPGVNFSVGDAQRLAFPDQAFDLVTARHMLYHVPDAAMAIREIHRVLRLGGSFLAVTNAMGYMNEYTQAVREAARFIEHSDADAFKKITVAVSATFTETNGEPMIRNAFGNVDVQFLESALVFNEAEPVLRYFDSLRSLKAVDSKIWDQTRANLGQIVADRLKNGPWRVQKRLALLFAVRSSA